MAQGLEPLNPNQKSKPLGFVLGEKMKDQMINKESAKFHFNWKEYAKTWANYTPPARPAKSDILVIGQHVKEFIAHNHRTPKVMILGATPEFRDLLADYDAFVTLVDINPEMKMAMDLLVTKPNPQEIFVKSDWLSLDQKLAKESFDIAIGDFVTNNIDYLNRHKFLSNIRTVLKPNGYFISRDYVAIKKRKTFSQIMDLYRGKENINYTVMWWDFLFNLTYNEQTGTISNGKISEVTAGATESEKEILEKYFKYFPPFEKVWTVPKKEDQDKEYQCFFKIEKVVYNKDYPYSEICPIYFLKKI